MISKIRRSHCGEAVYFYTNDYGSRVLFDEVGGKWEKHHCFGMFHRETKIQPKPAKSHVILIKHYQGLAFPAAASVKKEAKIS
jgi:hypothetical protein